jgi:hypothetical protein
MIYLLGHECNNDLLKNKFSDYTDTLFKFRKGILDSLPVYAVHQFSSSAPQDYELCCADFGYTLAVESYAPLSSLSTSSALDYIESLELWSTIPLEDRLDPDNCYIEDWYYNIFSDTYSLDEYKVLLARL